MGWSCSWVAVRGKNPETILSDFALVRTGELWEMPEGDWSCTSLPNGWFILFAVRDCEPKEFKPEALVLLSTECEVVASAVEEHVMFCSSSYWSNGKNVWSVVHDAQQGIYHLKSSGEVPKSFNAIQTTCREKQEAEGGEKAEVDYMFDVPLALGAELTGFRHDYDYPTTEEKPFEVLHFSSTRIKEDASANKPWWKIW
jgi:hypothetical protein